MDDVDVLDEDVLRDPGPPPTGLEDGAVLALPQDQVAEGCVAVEELFNVRVR